MSEAARLAETLEQLLTLIVRRQGQLAELDPGALTPTQRMALTAVADRGALRLGTLADHVATTDATASRTVDALAAAGMVKRVADPHDRRGVLIAPTPRGRRLVAARRRRLVELMEQGLATMPETDQARLVDLLGELNELLGAAPAGTVEARQ
jgi:DNA-binding MarR family transcriptional regulator